MNAEKVLIPKVCFPAKRFFFGNVNLEILKALLTGWMYIAPTYDNGDNTDFWCDNYQMVPNNINSNPALAYGSCSRKLPGRIYVTDGGVFLLKDVVKPADYFMCK